MATTDRELLLAQVKTDLAGIDGTGNYTNTVISVNRDVASADEMGQLPAIAMMDEGDEIDLAQSTLRMHMKIVLALVCAVPNDQATPASTLINSWLGDVHEAMLAGSNKFHSNYAHNTTYIGVDPLNVYTSAVTGFVARYHLHYSVAIGNPNNV